MFRWALIFLTLAIVSGLCLLTGVAEGSPRAIQILFGLSFVLFLSFLGVGVFLSKKLSRKAF